MFENDITLLLIGCVSLLKCEVWTTGQRIKFPLLVFRVICDDKSKSGQGQWPLSLTSVQNTSCHEILQVLMLIHNDFKLRSFKQMTSLVKGIHDCYKFFIMNLIINLHKRKNTKMEVDMMKKIVFSKLWKYGAYCKVRNVHLQNKRFKRVYMNKGCGSLEKNLQRLKGIISLNFPRKRLILLSQMSKRGNYWKILSNETLIKVAKSKKTLEISNRSWNNLVNNGLQKSMWMPSLEMM